MEFHQIRYFLALSETLNFTRAAEMCNVSQPSLTRAIQTLEGELGGALFRRERHNTHPTELGRMMRPYFEQMVAQTEAARGLAKTFAKLEDTTLKLGVMCTIGPTMISEFLLAFGESHPGVDIQVIDAAAQRLETMLLEGDIEVAIYGLPAPPHERLHALPLFCERFVIALAPHHPLAAKPVLHCKDLDGQRYINRINCEVFEAATAAVQARGVEVKTVFRSERDDWVQAMIAAGLGFGFFPEYCVTTPGIVTRPLIEPEMARTIDLLTVRGRRHSPAVGAFVRAAKTRPWTPAGAEAARRRAVALAAAPDDDTPIAVGY